MIKEVVIAPRGSGKSTVACAWKDRFPDALFIDCIRPITYPAAKLRGTRAPQVIIDEFSWLNHEMQDLVMATSYCSDIYLTISAEHTRDLSPTWRSYLLKEHPEWFI